MSAPELPCGGNHTFGQGGRCTECGIDRADTYPDRRHAQEREYFEQVEKLSRGEN
jgi:hypothetical protein